MSTPVIPGRAGSEPTIPQPHRRRRNLIWVGLGIVAALVASAWLVLIAGLHGVSRPVPSFPSLATSPDPSIQGTVAYTDMQSRCVRIVAAAGGPSRDVLCLAPSKQDPATAAVVGKEMVFPQLVWRSDGRLEVTMILMKPIKGKPPVYAAEWQKIVNVVTGSVEDVSTSALPPEPNLSTQPTTNPAGQKVTWSSDGDGRVKVVLTDSNGSRTLMSATGPGEYTYALHSAFWAPNWRWIAADDGRILVITPGPPPRTRILVDGAGGSWDYPVFAVTDGNMMAGAGRAGA